MGAHHTPGMIDHLRNTRPWVLFLSILCVLSGVGLLFLAVGAFILPHFEGSEVAFTERLALTLIGLVFYGGSGVFVLFLGILLYRYSHAIARIPSEQGTPHIERAIDAQRIFFKASGVATIVAFGVLILGLIGVAVAAVATMGSGL